MNEPLIIVFGPTAVGKTDLLVKLFRQGVEIINADSMQVYRYMDIGTAKPCKDLVKELPHHLIDVVEPDFQFNAGEFVRSAESLIKSILKKGKRPVLAGGTAFYLKSFIYGLPQAPVGNKEVRDSLKKILKKKGLPFLVEELKKADPVSAGKIAENDSYRVIRALEVYKISGKPLSWFKKQNRPKENYRFTLIGLNRDRGELYGRVNRRVDTMFDSGLFKEVKSLLERGYTFEDPGMKGIGYREFAEFIKGGMSIFDLKELIKRNSRRYAKRQITFFKSLPDVQWFHPDEIGKITEYIKRGLDHDPDFKA